MAFKHTKEPITPYLERVRDLFEKKGVSTILVAGSSGAFFHVADLVIQMDEYKPVDITDHVKALCASYPVRLDRRADFLISLHPRVMTRREGEHTGKNYYGDKVTRPEQLKLRIHGKEGFSLGRQEVELSALEQICDTEQTAALAFLLKEACERQIDGKKTLSEIVLYLYGRLEKEGLSVFRDCGYVNAGYAIPRLQEIFGCFNRYRRP